MSCYVLTNDYVLLQVNMNGLKHSYGLVNKCGDTMALSAWSRSKFLEEYKVDYINNNLSESFNSWVSKTKDMYIVQMLDQIRQMIIKKFEIRWKISRKMIRRIIPHFTRTLNEQSKNMKGHEVLICGNSTTEVTMAALRHAVNLGETTFSCQT
jgi:hypothetical protein